MSGTRFGVVADDITGANDIGIMFAKAGYETHVYSLDDEGRFRLPEARAALPVVCILDTNSRLDSREAAYRKVFAATRLLQAAGCRQFHNKTCSVFRGNIGAEFDAMLDALGAHFAVVVLGYPKNGRRTVDGIHFVHGRPLAESEFRQDPVHPINESNLLTILARQTSRQVALLSHSVIEGGAEALRAAIETARSGSHYLILDVPDQHALGVIARAVHDLPVLCGSAAIAEELAALWGPAPGKNSRRELPERSSAGVLCVAGSLMPQTAAQIEHLRARGVAAHELATVDLFDGPRRLQEVNTLVSQISQALIAGQDVVLYASNRPEEVARTRRLGAQRGLSETDTARLVSGSLAETAERVLAATGANRLVVAGGETSAEVSRKLHISGLCLWREIQPGLPSCCTLERPYRWLVLKSGSFGTPDFLELAMRHIRIL